MINKVILLGRIGKDPEFKNTQSGMSLCKFSIATSKKIKGEQKTEWHNITTFGKLADIVGQYCKKGQLVYVEGEISSNEVTSKEGVKIRFYGINANTIQMLEKREVQDEHKKSVSMQDVSNTFDGADYITNDDLPF